jgi:hypothetical protein
MRAKSLQIFEGSGTTAGHHALFSLLNVHHAGAQFRESVHCGTRKRPQCRRG